MQKNKNENKTKQKSQTSCEPIHPLPSLQPMQSIMGGIKNSPNQKHGVEERKPRLGGSTQMTSPLSCSSSVAPISSIGSDPSDCAHITQDNSKDYTSCPATPDQQNKSSSCPMSRRAWETEAQRGSGLNCPILQA